MTPATLPVRPPAVDGLFYPNEPDELADAITSCFADAVQLSADAPVPKALVVPHAGYVYSGPIAGSGYLRLRTASGTIRRVVLLGPSHWVPVRGLAVSSAAAFETPFGLVPVDDTARRTALEHPSVGVGDLAHAREHSLEVQLPFLQAVLDSFDVLPLVVGHVDDEAIAEVLASLAGGAETLIVISTDLSHYEPYEVARVRDQHTASAIVALAPDRIDDHDACGAYPLRGLLRWARAEGLRVEQLDLRNSGDTAGDHSKVVGYGCFAAR